MNKAPSTLHTLIFDTKLKRPGCVLIQACGGGDRRLLGDLFPAETWLTSPTPDMKEITGTREQWEMVAKDGHHDRSK